MAKANIQIVCWTCGQGLQVSPSLLKLIRAAEAKVRADAKAAL